MVRDPAAQELLLALLEARELLVTRRALVNYHGKLGEALVASGLLEPAGYEKAVVASDEDDSPIYKVSVDTGGQELGYFSSLRGWVPVQQEALQRYRLRVDDIVQMLVGGDLRSPTKGIVELVADFVWEIGLLRIVKTALTPVWFARRLSDSTIRDELRAANARQPASTRRLVLTSTPHDRLPAAFDLEGSTVLSIADILNLYTPMRIDLGRLAARFAGKAAAPATEPLHLSTDGSTLTILGAEIVFGGDNQRSAIRLLVAAYRDDRGVNAAKLLEQAGFGPSVRTFPQAFRKQWGELRHYLKPRDKKWRFEL